MGIEGSTPNEIITQLSKLHINSRKNLIQSLSPEARKTLDKMLDSVIKNPHKIMQGDGVKEIQKQLKADKWEKKEHAFDKIRNVFTSRTSTALSDKFSDVSKTLNKRDALMRHGLEFEKKGKPIEARKRFEAAAQLGSGSAYLHLGRMDRSEENFKKGAQLGDVLCHLEMAKLCRLEQRNEEAIDWVMRAGKMATSEYKEAIEAERAALQDAWAPKTAELPSGETPKVTQDKALSALEEYPELSGIEPEDITDEGVEKLIASLESPAILENSGDALAAGLDALKAENPTSARELFEAAAKQGSGAARHQLGLLDLKEAIKARREKNLDKANELHGKALAHFMLGARKGEVHCQLRVAADFFSKKDYTRAEHWLQKAEEQNDPSVSRVIERLRRELEQKRLASS